MLSPPTSNLTPFRIVSVSVLGAVLLLSFLPSDAVDPVRLVAWDAVDIGHVLAYGALTGATLLSIPKRTLRRGIGAVFTISLLGFAIELLQPLAGRTASVVDFAENEIGIAVGIAIFCCYWFGRRIAAGKLLRP